MDGHTRVLLMDATIESILEVRSASYALMMSQKNLSEVAVGVGECGKATAALCEAVIALCLQPVGD